jgi:hypothetical protein
MATTTAMTAIATTAIHTMTRVLLATSVTSWFQCVARTSAGAAARINAGASCLSTGPTRNTVRTDGHPNIW